MSENTLSPVKSEKFMNNLGYISLPIEKAGCDKMKKRLYPNLPKP